VAFQKVASLDDLWSGEMTAVSVDGQYILLVNIDDIVRAYADACPHMRTRLSQGSLQGRMLTCATHQWQFDAFTGKGINPETACLEEFPVQIESGDILVDLVVAASSGDEKPVKWCER
jgi:toluene monooxygenase system ferredoxin subunit